MKVAANPCLCRMHIAEIVRPINDPEFLVAGCIIKNLFVLRQNNQRGKTEFGTNRNDVLLGILHRPGTPRVRYGQAGPQPHEANGSQNKTEARNELSLRDTSHLFPPELNWLVAEISETTRNWHSRT